MRKLYPPVECNRSGYLSVDQFQVYWEESGNPKGIPAIFLHGGPGNGYDPSCRQFFDPKKYRIVLMDQRGSGKSHPFSELENNTTWHLVNDIEKLKIELGIDQWVVFGGSWGSTLSLAYAESYPKSVLALVLRGIFLGTTQELLWMYQTGAKHILPDQYEKFIEPIAEEKRDQLLDAYYELLTSSNASLRKRAAIAWSSWEGAALKLLFDPKIFERFTEDIHADALARIECHYFVNKCFFKAENWLLENISEIQDIPAVIIHGRYDLICPMDSAWRLHQAYPKAEFKIIPDAGHAASEPGIIDALIEATDDFARMFS